MKSWKWWALAALAVGAPMMARAENDDRMMGFYEGGFTGGSGAATSLYARVAGLSDRSWKVVFYAGSADGGEVRVEAEAVAPEPREPAVLSGEVDLGALGGKVSVSGTLERRKLNGEIGGRAFSLKRVDKESPTLGQPAPEGAIVLFDGTNFDPWRRDPETWCLQPDGSMQVCGSNFRTKEDFGSGHYHLEFMTPYMPNAREQARGNSGVYLLGRYEVQVLDNFGWEPKWDLCGGIYRVAVPLKDATYPPLTWQTYDITFTAAQFDAAGNKTANARITVVHNGVTVHDNLELPRPTPGGVSGDDAVAGPLLLQDHRDDVKFRNIWFKPAG